MGGSPTVADHANDAKHSCTRVTERGGASSEAAAEMNKNQIEGVAEQGVNTPKSVPPITRSFGVVKHAVLDGG